MVTSPALLVLLVILAVARVTRLVVEDVILDRPRAWLQARADGLLGYLLTCPWCVSVHVGLAVTGGTYAWHAYWPVQVLLIGLAASQITGMLAPHTYPED